jgi:hypothetical protein
VKSNAQKYEVTTLIADIAITRFQTGGSPVRLDDIAADLARHHGNTTAKHDVDNLYGRAILLIRKSGTPVVPVTEAYFAHIAAGTQPHGDEEIAACIAGLAGSGRRTVGLHFPTTRDDLLFIENEIGRLKSGAGKVAAVTGEVKGNGHLLSQGEESRVLGYQPKRVKSNPVLVAKTP